jgi:hypothetical protein
LRGRSSEIGIDGLADLARGLGHVVADERGYREQKRIERDTAP